MNLLQERRISCPYCGESISLLVDCSCEEQGYTEDCQVCCQPIVVQVYVAGEDVQLYAQREDD
jgi:transcription elongation factor Elf1